ncbi:ATPase [Salipiger sp. CCB-MM3]|uniref:cation-translocating P-type ATPase n=1 Tax=Salipiger sp. CCB-MM3 TaxID=1792508 RepID=UPI00080A9945|nr:cation-transporting P-type ATPase [Salipiger sp. CCB-MM3]ANT62048.1 ATPase [Salipiger sp. CCB-MM3]
MPPPAETGFHALSAADTATRLGVAPDAGLSGAEADKRLAQVGPNRLREQKPQSLLTLLLHQLRSVIVWLLVAAAGFSLLVQDHVEALAILAVLALNTAIGFFTELRAARSMEALLHMAEVQTRVRRGGAARMVDARDLVPGDVVILEAGDVITADLRLTRASGLYADESVLTGESLPVEKSADPAAPEAPLAERRSMVFKGTALTRGSGEALVTATGMATELGRISKLAQEAEAEASPLERRLARLGQKLVWLTLALALVMIGAGVARGHALIDMIQTGVALAVAAIPEGLPVVATLCLARGMWRMARHNAVITRLASVETLGATTVILTDKTGTLTENRMQVARFLLDEGDTAFPPESAVAKGSPLALALQVGALCNGAELGQDGTRGTGDPMELALLEAAKDAGIAADTPALIEHAFDPERRMMATVHAGDGGVLYAVKGAPESVLEVCDRVLSASGETRLDETARARWLARNEAAAADGLRGLALAMKHAATPDEAPYEGLTLLGLVCFADPLRADVPPAIAACRAAGIRVVMITGDHAQTAARIARDAGLHEGAAEVIEGSALAGFDPATASEDDRARLRRADVFARVAPEMKLALVAAYQRDGEIVAMTGDGVNDAPALKKADIGIAMGQRGTQVAREAAHMVLRDDRLATIVEAVHQGRVIFGNIRKFVVYLMSCNLCEVLVVTLAVSAGLPAPLLPLQILFLNLVTDVFPAFALGMGRGDAQEMQRPPRDPAEPILGRAQWIWITALGGLLAAATLGAFALALYALHLPGEEAITVAFVTLALAQLWNVFNMRAPGTGLLDNDVLRNPYVWGALALCTGLIAAALWLPGLSQVLRLPSPGGIGLGLAFGLSLVPLVVGQIATGLRAARPSEARPDEPAPESGAQVRR